MNFVTIAVVPMSSAIAVGVDIAGGNNGDFLLTSPGHDAPDVRQDATVIAYAVTTAGQHAVLLGIDIDQNLPSPSSYQLE